MFLSVGIMSSSEAIIARFHGQFLDNCGVLITDGEEVCLSYSQSFESRRFEPIDESDSWFELRNVTIGIDFHWQRRENQQFKGSLRVVASAGMLWAINDVEIEDYLTSVISSEMNSQASLEFLKAHAVISRSWVMAQIDSNQSSGQYNDIDERIETDEEVVRWMDHSSHTLFHVCADDHCQRYQGIGRIKSATAFEAVRETCGEILVDDEGRVCDTRFSKCCGGRFELFENCWQSSEPHPYLVAKEDICNQEPSNPTPLYSRGKILCDTSDKTVLKQVLNDYDLETSDFFKWSVAYPAGVLEEILKEKSGIDFGEIEEIVPLSRGYSGRVYRLKIKGSLKTMLVGKELEIRRWLSRSHLKSSAFDVSRTTDGGWRFDGKGWGHGVGLCQIGAAVMAAQGYDYRQILNHYFPGSRLVANYGDDC